MTRGTRRAGGLRTDLRRLFGSGASATLDQGLFAGANFLLNLVLARWLAPGEYGVFALAFSLFLLLAAAHTALLVEPMMVFGTGRYRERLPAYVAVLLRGHALFSVTSGALLALVAAVAAGLGQDALARTALALAVASPFILFFWLARRACWTVPDPLTAVVGAAVYLAVLLGATWALFQGGGLSAVTALAAMAAASVAAGAWTLRRLGMGPRGAPRDLAREALRVHARYGRWAVSSAAAGWVPTQAFFVLLPLFGGFAATAQLRAMTNLIMPVMNVITALGFVVLPLQVARHGDRRAFARLNATFAGVFVAGAAAYWLILAAWGEPIVRFVYGGAYLDHVGLLRIVALVPLFLCLEFVPGSALRSLVRPDLAFRASAAAAAVALTLGAWATHAYGVNGAAAGMVAAVAAAAATGWILLARRGGDLPTPGSAADAAEARRP